MIRKLTPFFDVTKMSENIYLKNNMAMETIKKIALSNAKNKENIQK